MFSRQLVVQLSLKPVGRDPRDLKGMELIQFIKDMKMALDSEAQEMLDEVGWKPWATSRHVNHQRVKEELIDAWHFWMNLWLCVGGTADEMLEMYLKKSQKNIDRQLEGYDGVTGKCLSCHTDLTEARIDPIVHEDAPEGAFCSIECCEKHIYAVEN